MKTPNRSFLICRLLTFALALLATAPGLFAAGATWTGLGGDGLWANTGNWSASPVPGSADIATFSDAPTTDLYNGQDWANMGRFEIARHWGNGASAAPRNWAAGTPLPGFNNVGFTDGHAQAVKLRDLRSLTWNKTWPQ